MGMTRKPKPPAAKSRLLTEKEQLQQVQAEIARKQAELEARLKQLPGKVEAVRQREKELQRINVSTVARGEINGRLREFRNAEGHTRSRRRPLRGEARAARIKFAVLCIVLFTILILVWRTMPS